MARNQSQKKRHTSYRTKAPQRKPTTSNSAQQTLSARPIPVRDKWPGTKVKRKDTQATEQKRPKESQQHPTLHSRLCPQGRFQFGTTHQKLQVSTQALRSTMHSATVGSNTTQALRSTMHSATVGSNTTQADRESPTSRNLLANG